MKIRNGFVSNSSSSSFCIFGVSLTENEYKKLIKDAVEALKLETESKPKPAPIPSCKHKFDRETLKFCGVCGKTAYEPVVEEDDYDDENSYDVQELIDDCDYVKKNKLDVMNIGGDGENDICMGLNIGDSELKGDELIKEITRVNGILKLTYSRKAQIFAGETYN